MSTNFFYFGSYRTLRMRLSDDTWEERVIDESKEDVMQVIMAKQKEQKIKDIQLQEISTEEVIKKIYEGSAAASPAAASTASAPATAAASAGGEDTEGEE